MTKHLSHVERRRQIMDAARSSFVSSGYDHSRMNDIARQAGLSKGGVYFHFKSKRELFDALVDREFELAMETLERITASEAPASAMLGQIAAYYLERFASKPDVTRFPVVVGEMAIRDEALLERLRDLHLRFLKSLSDVIERGTRDGEFRHVDPDVASLLLKALMDGLERQYMLGNGNTFKLGDLVTAGLDLVMRGLGPNSQPHPKAPRC